MPVMKCMSGVQRAILSEREEGFLAFVEKRQAWRLCPLLEMGLKFLRSS